MGTDTREIARYLHEWWAARLAHPESLAAASAPALPQ
jgi:hypothetical protein